MRVLVRPRVVFLTAVTLFTSACHPFGPEHIDFAGTWVGTMEIQTCFDLGPRVCGSNEFGRPGHRQEIELQITESAGELRIQIQIDGRLSQRMTGDAAAYSHDSEFSFSSDLYTRFGVLRATIDWEGKARGGGGTIIGTATVTYVATDRSPLARTRGRVQVDRR